MDNNAELRAAAEYFATTDLCTCDPESGVTNCIGCDTAAFARHYLATVPADDAEPVTVGDWLPIETAPKDGTRVRLWVVRNNGHEEETHGMYSSYVGDMVDDDYLRFFWGIPTHWLPIVGPKLREGE